MSISHGFLRRALAGFVCVVSVAAGFALVFRSSASDVLPSVPTPQLVGLLALMVLPGCVLLLARADRAAQVDAQAQSATHRRQDLAAARGPVEAPASDLDGLRMQMGDAARAHAPTRPGEDASDRHRRRIDAGPRVAGSRSGTLAPSTGPTGNMSGGGSLRRAS